MRRLIHSPSETCLHLVHPAQPEKKQKMFIRSTVVMWTLLYSVQSVWYAACILPHPYTWSNCMEFAMIGEWALNGACIMYHSKHNKCVTTLFTMTSFRTCGHCTGHLPRVVTLQLSPSPVCNKPKPLWLDTIFLIHDSQLLCVYMSKPHEYLHTWMPNPPYTSWLFTYMDQSISYHECHLWWFIV